MTPGQGPKTHFRGKQSIDGIWYTPDLELKGASYLSFDADMGDHRPVMADFTEASLLGVNLPNIVPPDARRLNCKIERIRSKYIKDLEEKFERHNILERLKKLSKDATFPVSKEEIGKGKGKSRQAEIVDECCRRWEGDDCDRRRETVVVGSNGSNSILVFDKSLR